MRRFSSLPVLFLAMLLFSAPAFALSSRSAPLAPEFLESRGHVSGEGVAGKTGYRPGPLDLSQLGALSRPYGRLVPSDCERQHEHARKPGQAYVERRPPPDPKTPPCDQQAGSAERGEQCACRNEHIARQVGEQQSRTKVRGRD